MAKNTSADVGEQFRNVWRRIEVVARRRHRALEDISVIAICKTYPAAALRVAIEAGVRDLGENRVQEAEGKIIALGRHAARWHLVGHLQTNKARRAVKLFDVIHSLDSAELARRLDRLCLEEGREQLPVLIQIDLGGEESKTGIHPDALLQLLGVVGECPRLRLTGLMTLPPYFENPERARPFFIRLRELRDELQAEGHFGNRPGDLSMGMSHDFEVAIEEGATMLRIGTAIFGERNPT